MSQKLIIRIMKQIRLRSLIRARLPYLGDLKNTIALLDDSERYLIREAASEARCSPHLLAILDDLDLISVPAYIVRIDRDEQQRVFSICDTFFEEFPALFAKIARYAFEPAFLGHLELQEILSDYLKLYSADLFQNPEEAKESSISSLFNLCNEKVKLEISSAILTSFLQENPTSLVEAISLQKDFDFSFHPTVTKVLSDCLNHESSEQLVEKLLLKAAKEPTNWKNYSEVLKLAGPRLPVALLQNFLRDLFKTGVKERLENPLFLMFFSARAGAKSVPGFTYYAWYKSTIGEMTYRIDREEFKYVMKVLSRMVDLERDPEVLETHLKIAIQAPSLCNELVQMYKTILRSKIETLGHSQDPREVIEID